MVRLQHTFVGVVLFWMVVWIENYGVILLLILQYGNGGTTTGWVQHQWTRISERRMRVIQIPKIGRHSLFLRTSTSQKLAQKGPHKCAAVPLLATPSLVDQKMRSASARRTSSPAPASGTALGSASGPALAAVMSSNISGRLHNRNKGRFLDYIGKYAK
jgi:hypothetical protein